MCLVLLLAVSGCSGPLPEPDPALPPNVILLSIDTLRADFLGCYGHPGIRTPVIDMLSRQGRLCADHHVNSNWTLPSHASIFTSQYVADHRLVYDNGALPDRFVTLAETFRSAGYRTGGFYSVQHFTSHLKMDRGFDSMALYDWVDAADRALIDTWVGAEPGRPFFLFLHTFEPHAPYGGYRDYRLTQAGAGLRDLETFDAFTRQYEAGDSPAGWRDFREGMLMLLLGFQKGADRHAPQIRENVKTMTEAQLRLWRDVEEIPIANVLDPWFESDLYPPDVSALLDNYRKRVETVDIEMGRLLETLHRAGRLDNTIICLTSDHGEAFFERNRVYGHGGNRRNIIDPHHVADTSFYSELISTPLIFHGVPGGTMTGIEPRLTCSLDIMPTLLQITGQSLPAGLSGVPVANGAPEGRFTVAENQRTMRRAVITSQWKMITGVEPVELYDRIHDPFEAVNLDNTAVRNELAALFTAWSAGRELTFSPGDAPVDREIREQLQMLGYLHDPDSR